MTCSRCSLAASMVNCKLKYPVVIEVNEVALVKVLVELTVPMVNVAPLGQGCLPVGQVQRGSKNPNTENSNVFVFPLVAIFASEVMMSLGLGMADSVGTVQKSWVTLMCLDQMKQRREVITTRSLNIFELNNDFKAVFPVNKIKLITLIL